MSLAALLDSRVTIWRLDDGAGTTNRLGEPNKAPTVSQTGLRGSLAHARLLQSKDTGAGDKMTGVSTFLIDAKADVRLNDIFVIDSGPNVGSIWTVAGFFGQPSRAKHKEGYVRPYVGAKFQ